MFTWLINKLFENLTFEYRLSLKIEEQIRNWELYKEKQYFFKAKRDRNIWNISQRPCMNGHKNKMNPI